MADKNQSYINLPTKHKGFIGDYWKVEDKKFDIIETALEYRENYLKNSKRWSDEEQAKHEALLEKYSWNSIAEMNHSEKNLSEDNFVSKNATQEEMPPISIFLIAVGALQLLGGLIIFFQALPDYEDPDVSQIIQMSIGISSILTSAFWFGFARIISELVKIRLALDKA